MDFAVLADHRMKIKEIRYLDFAKGQKIIEHEGDNGTNCKYCAWNDSQRLGKGAGGVGNRRTSGDHSDNSIVKIAQNSEKSPGDLMGLDFSQTPMKTIS